MRKKSRTFISPHDRLCWNYSNLHFQDYLLWAEKLITNSRQNTAQVDRDTVIAANMPYEWLPTQPKPSHGKYTHGILLVHGLLDSPFSMREIGRRFQEHGFLVRSVLLPGHGTVPADLQYVTMEDWLETVKFGFDSLARDVDNIWAAGFSGGASLALHHALKDVDITAMITVSPSLRLCNPYARYARLLRLLSHYANIPIWLDALDNDDYTKYGTYPVNLAAQAHRLAHTVHHLLETQTYDHPLWMALSADDETTDSHLARKVFLKQPHTANRLLWYCAEPQLSIEPRVIHRNSAFPDEHVLDFSHTSMQISPENPHYGRMGDYVPPLYTPKNDIQDRTIYRGALTKKNLAKHVMRRLTYNPDYVFMMSQLDAFIKQASTLCH